MRLLLLIGLMAMLVLAKPAEKPAAELQIDSAPSVVSYQGSSQTHTRFVIAPMGRALGYVEPTNLNRTLQTTPSKEQMEQTVTDLLQTRPVYVHHN